MSHVSINVWLDQTLHGSTHTSRERNAFATSIYFYTTIYIYLLLYSDLHRSTCPPHPIRAETKHTPSHRFLIVEPGNLGQYLTLDLPRIASSPYPLFSMLGHTQPRLKTNHVHANIEFLGGEWEEETPPRHTHLKLNIDHRGWLSRVLQNFLCTRSCFIYPDLHNVVVTPE